MQPALLLARGTSEEQVLERGGHSSYDIARRICSQARASGPAGPTNFSGIRRAGQPAEAWTEQSSRPIGGGAGDSMASN